MLRVVHLSDFHYSLETKKDFVLYCTNPLISDLKKIHKEKSIDLIIFSGDLIDKGGLSFGNGDIDLAFLTFEEEVIVPILDALGLQKDRFLFVPGNHDINRRADSTKMELGMFADLSSIERVNNYIDTNDLSDGSKRIIPFKEFEKSYYSNTNHEISNFASTFKYNFDGLRVGVSCFNSSWRCWDSEQDKGKILLGERQLETAIESLEGFDLKLAVIHHPIDWLSSIERENIELMLYKSYNIMLCGHVHEGDSEYKTNKFNGSLLVSVAPANWSVGVRSNDSAYSNGYTYIDYDSDSAKVVLSNRVYFHKKQAFGPNVGLGDDEGKAIYYLPQSPLFNIMSSKNEICETIRTEQFSQINEHLLSYRTETLAPKSLDKLFVLPPLSSRISKDKEKSYTLEELCLSESHILLTGPKESGKTILLDKLLMEFTDNIFRYNKIPILIDLESSSSKIETEISRFLKVKIKKVEEILSSLDFVLLIDRLSASPKVINKLKSLEHFLEKNKNVRVIATTTSSLLSSDIPIELKKFPILSKMLIIQINLLKSKQIRELTSNWFSRNPNYNNSESIDEIIKIFNKLDITRTPLSVSMLLCIFEIQPANLPINNALLLENYIEILFEKHAPNEMFSEEFNFKNKIRLVAEIAYLMFNIKDHSYRINRSDLMKFIEDYMFNRKFHYKADEILNGLENVGLFKEENVDGKYYLSFRFNCFFKFFLMKNMMFREHFKNDVLSEASYLNFIDEIDFYTGIQGDQEKVLFDLKNRMLQKFQTFVEEYEVLTDLDRVHLQTNSMLTSNLSDNLLENLNEGKQNNAEETIDELNDAKLEMSSAVQETDMSLNDELSIYHQLEKSLLVVAKVLKNTEETIDGQLKSTCYKELLYCASVFVSLARIILEEKNTEINNNIFLDYLPVGMQMVLHNEVSSAKLNVVMEEDIKEKLKNPKLFSELEIFFSIFLYSESKVNSNLRYVKNFINIHRYNYIKENILAKLFQNFLSKPKYSSQEIEYLNLLAELASIGNDLNAKNLYKNKVIEKFKVEKDRRMRNNELSIDIV